MIKADFWVISIKSFDKKGSDLVSCTEVIFISINILTGEKEIETLYFLLDLCVKEQG